MKNKDRETTRVSFRYVTNSTMFCNECGAAVCRDQEYCPGCGREVIPKNYDERWRIAMQKYRRR